jgi:phosphoribosylglycinamide formyltransferase 1
MRTRVGILISGNGSTLQSVLDSREICDVNVVIASKESAYGIARARRAGAPVEILPPELKGAANKVAAEKWIIEKLEKYRVQKVILAGFMRIISHEFIKKYSGNIFNIHPSLLPKYKGIDSFEEALKAGDKSAGVTVHHVAAEVDSGEFILQREFEIPEKRDSVLSHLFLHIQEQRILRESLRKVLWQTQI